MTPEGKFWATIAALATVVAVSITIGTTAYTIHLDRMKADRLRAGDSAAEVQCAFNPPVDDLENAIICGGFRAE